MIPIPDNPGGLGPSLIRTYTPVLVGALVTFLSRKWGIIIDEDASADLTLALGGIATLVFYTVVRILEKEIPAVGWLLGLAKQPAYSPETAPEAEPIVVPEAAVDEATVATFMSARGVGTVIEVNEIATEALEKKRGLTIALEKIRDLTS